MMQSEHYTRHTLQKNTNLARWLDRKHQLQRQAMQTSYCTNTNKTMSWQCHKNITITALNHRRRLLKTSAGAQLPFPSLLSLLPNLPPFLCSHLFSQSQLSGLGASGSGRAQLPNNIWCILGRKSASGEQRRRQDLLRGGAKLEIRSWGTHVGLESQVQQLLDD